MTDSQPLVAAHVYVSGKVQGVGFRAATRAAAQRLGLSGWVRNLPDGRVEALFVGPKDAVEQMVAWCHRGPRAARVSQVKVDWKLPGSPSGPDRPGEPEHPGDPDLQVKGFHIRG